MKIMLLFLSILLFLILYIFAVILISILVYVLYTTFQKHLPWYIYIYPCFIFKNKYPSVKPIKIGMIFDITYIRTVFRLSKKSKLAWDKCFTLGLKNLFIEIEKYKNQVFFTKTHTKIFKKLVFLENKEIIQIINCKEVGEKYLYHTLRPPFEKTMFYEIEFTINSINIGAKK